MKIDSFRELLLKKSADSSLQNMIRFVRDDVMADIMLESLEKMARSKHRGDTANFPLRDFGLEMDKEHEPRMIHDALSHHASAYKSALKNNRTDKANHHAGEMFKIIDMADRAQKHSHGKLDIQAVSPHAWERNHKKDVLTEDDGPVRRGNKKAGAFRNDTKGWRYRTKDYSFLQSNPHDSYSKETDKHGHKEAYPMEHIRVNNDYLHIEDIPADQLDSPHVKTHPFDKHPIMSHYNDKAVNRSADKDRQYLQDVEAYHDGPHTESYFAKHDNLMAADPKGYAKRGSEVSSSVHPKIESQPEQASAAVSEQPSPEQKPDLDARIAAIKSGKSES